MDRGDFAERTSFDVEVSGKAYVRWPGLGDHGGLGDLLWNATFSSMLEPGLKS